MDRPAVVLNGKDELIRLYAAVSQEYGPRVTLKKFCRLTGLPEGAIYRLVDSFGELREAVGLSRRVKQETWYSQNDLMEAFHNVVQRLGRLPTCREFGLYSPMSQRVLFQRLGGINGAIAKYRDWLPRQKEPKPPDDFESAMNPQKPAADPELTIRWMQNEWFGLRVGFEMRSGDFQGRPADACDVLVVLNHDWPACPVPVIVFGKILRKEPEF